MESEMDQKERLRLLLLGDDQDSSQDETISALVSMMAHRFLLIIRRVQKRYGLPLANEIPEELAWIHDEAVIRRFNRIGSEGYRSQSIEGHGVTFAEDDFADFMHDITDFFRPDEPEKYTPGKAVFF